jgi:hypothetical protein
MLVLHLINQVGGSTALKLRSVLRVTSAAVWSVKNVKSFMPWIDKQSDHAGNSLGVDWRPQAAASRLGVAAEILDVSNSADIDAVFVRLRDEIHPQGLLVTNNPLFIARRIQLAILAAPFAVPTIYPFRAQTEAGGLMSYGPDLADRDRESGRYASRILNGENPADLPVEQVNKFELVINVATAKALGLRQRNRIMPFRCAALCLLLAQSRHPTVARRCPLLGVKRTLRFQGAMSAFDPKRT